MNNVYPEPEPREHEVIRIGESAASGIIVCVIFGLIFAGVGIGVAIGAGAEFGVFAMIFGGVFALFGVAALIAGIVQMMAASRLAPPTVTISVQPLYLGESFHGELVQQVKKHANINAVTVKLICREWVQYRQGTDTHTDTLDVISEEFTLDVSGELHPPDSIAGDFEFMVPDNAMHSFRAADNRINWLLEIHTDVAGWPDYKSQVELDVAPRYAPLDEEL